ncbi:MAG: radical SAM protein [Smithella sp.]
MRLFRDEPLHFLLITPKITAYPYPLSFKMLSGGELPTVTPGFAYISASLKSIEKNVFNLNLEFESGDIDQIIEEYIVKNDINVVLTSGLSRHFTKVKQVVDSVRKLSRNITIIVGGGLISSTPQIAMQALEHADIGVIGEGEFTVQELACALRGQRELNTVTGLIFKNGTDYILTTPREEIKDLDSLPWPDYTGLGYDKLIDHIRSVPVVCGRSCPFRCTFCYHPSGNTYRSRSIDNIIAEIKWLKETYAIDAVHLIGEGLFLKQKEAYELCEKLRNIGIAWSCTMHAVYFEDDLIKTMKDSGCISVNLGVESACDRILKSMNKKTRFNTIENALQLLHKNKLSIDANFIFGDSQEDLDSVEETISWWRNNRIYPIDLIMIMIYPGTVMYKQALERGLIKDEVSYLQQNCPNINISRLSNDQYRELEMRLSAEKAFYTYSPAHFTIEQVDLENRRTKATYVCDCGHSGEVVTKGIMVSDAFSCPQCNQRYQIPFHTIYSDSFARKTVENLLRQHTKLAFWGIGIEMQIMLRKLDIQDMDTIFLIDKDTKKQQIKILGHEIYSHSKLQEEQIDTVILTPLAQNAVNNTIGSELDRYSVNNVVQFQNLLRMIDEDSHLPGRIV